MKPCQSGVKFPESSNRPGLRLALVWAYDSADVAPGGEFSSTLVNRLVWLIYLDNADLYFILHLEPPLVYPTRLLSHQLVATSDFQKPIPPSALCHPVHDC